MKNHTSGELVVVVGSGGIGYHAIRLLGVYLRRFTQRRPHTAVRCVVWDPDIVDVGNGARQWMEAAVGSGKAESFVAELENQLPKGDQVELLTARRLRVSATTDLLAEARGWVGKGLGVTVLVWPDNDQCRRDVMTALRAQVEESAVNGCALTRVQVVTAGNDHEGANAYGSLWHAGRGWLWDYDAQVLARVRAGGIKSEPGCNDQTALCNAAAGLMSFQLLEYLGHWEEGDDQFKLVFDATIMRQDAIKLLPWTDGQEAG